MPNKRILIVDDDPDIRANLGDILSDLGHYTDTAADGDSALRLADRQVYDVAVLDYRMPGMNGVTLMGAIHDRQGPIVTILVTAHADNATLRIETAPTDCAVLPKPVDMGQLLSLI